MMNDTPRNEAYRLAMKKLITPNDIVLDIGAGSGLLSMLAAKAGAKHVYSIEASNAFATIAKKIIDTNGLGKQITIIKDMSTHVTVKDNKKRKRNKKGRNRKQGRTIPQKATVLVAELLGTLLNGESTLRYYQDARQRLLTKNAKIIPASGAQYAVLINSDMLHKITSSKSYHGLDLRYFNTFRDSVSLLFTKHYGVCMNTLNYKEMTEHITVYEADLYKDGPEVQPMNERGRIYTVTALEDGSVQAIVFFWTVWMDKEKQYKISTNPKDTIGNLPRNMNWGQAVQLVEDPAGWTHPEPKILHLRKGQKVDVKIISDGVSLRARVVRVYPQMSAKEPEEKKAEATATQVSTQPEATATQPEEKSQSRKARKSVDLTPTPSTNTIQNDINKLDIDDSSVKPSGAEPMTSESSQS